MLTLVDLASALRSERRSMDSDELGPELNDFSNGLGSRWCFAARAGELLRRGFAGGLVAVAGRGECTAIMSRRMNNVEMVVVEGKGKRMKSRKKAGSRLAGMVRAYRCTRQFRSLEGGEDGRIVRSRVATSVHTEHPPAFPSDREMDCVSLSSASFPFQERCTVCVCVCAGSDTYLFQTLYKEGAAEASGLRGRGA